MAIAHERIFVSKNRENMVLFPPEELTVSSFVGGLAGVRTLREGLYLMTHAFRSYDRYAPM